MSRPVFDTNVFLSYRTRIPESDQIKMALSTVVLYELNATTIDKSDWQRYAALRRLHHKNGTLLTPSANDWWETAKLVSRIRFQDKRDAHGLTPPLSAPDRQVAKRCLNCPRRLSAPILCCHRKPQRLRPNPTISLG